MTTGVKATAQREQASTPPTLHTPAEAVLITGQLASQSCKTCAASLVYVDDPTALIVGVEAFRADRFVIRTPDGTRYATREEVAAGERCTP